MATQKKNKNIEIIRMTHNGGISHSIEHDKKNNTIKIYAQTDERNDKLTYLGMHKYEKIFYNNAFKSYALLLLLKSPKTAKASKTNNYVYLFISGMPYRKSSASQYIYKFNSDELIKKFYVPMGNSDMVYPWLLTNNYKYLLIETSYYNLAEIDESNKLKNANEDPYKYFYGFDKLETKNKQHKPHKPAKYYKMQIQKL